MTEENKTTAEETAEEVKETEAAEDEVTEATPETQAGSEDRKSTRLNSSHPSRSRMPSSA